MSVRDVGARIRARFKRFGVSASAAEVQQLVAYIGLLAKWNKTVNLTALVLEPPSDQAIDRLFVEPFLAARFLKQADGLLLDLGSGGGSPAIPLRIALPGVQLRMIEAKARKSAFLREAVRQLALSDSEVMNARMEDLLARPELHESASLISIRAVKADRRLWQTVSAFVKPGGRVLWFRSHSDDPDSGAYFPPFVLETVERLIPANNSELAVLRKQA